MTMFESLPQVESGNPLLTNALLAQRWRQRRQVRCVPDHVVSGLLTHFTVRPSGDGFRRTLIEAEVRARVDVETEAIQSFLDQCETLLRATGLRGLLERYREFEHPLEDIALDARDKAQENGISKIEPEILEPLRRWLMLTAIADELADDGYRETSLPATAYEVSLA